MPTTFTCTTPKDGWALYHHFLGNNLLIIQMQQESKNEESDEQSATERERAISDAWSKLVGHLYIIMRRMQVSGHNEDATNMQQIIDMTVELDVASPATHDTIFSKLQELDNTRNKVEFHKK